MWLITSYSQDKYVILEKYEYGFFYINDGFKTERYVTIKKIFVKDELLIDGNLYSVKETFEVANAQLSKDGIYYKLHRQYILQVYEYKDKHVVILRENDILIGKRI